MLGERFIIKMICIQKKKMKYTELQFQPAAVILQMLFNIATKRFRISGLFCSFIVGIMVFDATVF